VRSLTQDLFSPVTDQVWLEYLQEMLATEVGAKAEEVLHPATTGQAGGVPSWYAGCVRLRTVTDHMSIAGRRCLHISTAILTTSLKCLPC
jgi:hypothetical protein